MDDFRGVEVILEIGGTIHRLVRTNENVLFNLGNEDKCDFCSVEPYCHRNNDGMNEMCELLKNEGGDFNFEGLGIRDDGKFSF